jgi:hypothetical protein
MIKGRCGCWPFGVVNRVVSQKDVDGRDHSSGEYVVSHGPFVSWMGNLAMARDKRGYWPLWVDELQDADPVVSFESASTMGHGT